MTMTCASCKFLVYGLCLRYPQVVRKDAEDWCGEFKLKPVVKEEQKQREKGDK